MSEPERNLSLLEAANRLGVSPHTLRAWALYQNRIAYLRLGRRILFRVEDIEAFETRARIPAANTSPFPERPRRVLSEEHMAKMRAARERRKADGA